MIQTDKHGLVVPKRLNYSEKVIFAEFLKLERARHQEDIDKITKTLKEMKI